MKYLKFFESNDEKYSLIDSKEYNEKLCNNHIYTFYPNEMLEVSKVINRNENLLRYKWCSTTLSYIKEGPHNNKIVMKDFDMQIIYDNGVTLHNSDGTSNRFISNFEEILITNFTLLIDNSKDMHQKIYINKTSDDWFIVDVNVRIGRQYYKCDQIYGLVDFLTKFS